MDITDICKFITMITKQATTTMDTYNPKLEITIQQQPHSNQTVKRNMENGITTIV